MIQPDDEARQGAMTKYKEHITPSGLMLPKRRVMELKSRD